MDTLKSAAAAFKVCTTSGLRANVTLTHRSVLDALFLPFLAFGLHPTHQEDGAIGSQFTPTGAVGSIGEAVGGPLSSDGLIGKQCKLSSNALARLTFLSFIRTNRHS